MNLIKDLERRLETILEGFFTRQFKAGLQPIEVAKRLAREMDDNRTVSVSKVYVPNEYLVLVSLSDAERLSAFTSKLCDELADFLTAHAQRENYALVGRAHVLIEARHDLGVGEFKIDSALVDRPIGEKQPEERTEKPRAKTAADDGTKVMQAVGIKGVIEFPDADRTYPLLGARTTIGRAAENDIVIPDQSVSRRHAEVQTTAGHLILKDLGSRNGTLINGRKITEHVLGDGDEIRIGMSTLLFRREIDV